MRTGKRAPSHPGGILRRQHLEPLGLTVADLARALGMSRKTVSKVVNERGSVSADMALRLSQAFGTMPELWLNLQQNYNLWHAAKGSKGWRRVEPVAA